MRHSIRFVAGVLMVLALVSNQATGQALTTLHSFNGANGAYPIGSLTLSGSTLYGTTNSGGNLSKGTIFSIPTSGGSLTTMLLFNGANGANPADSLTLSPDGSTLYGMTLSGGVNNMGTIFSIPVGGGGLTTLRSFSGTNGAYPWGSLTLSPDGSTMYGMTNQGGDSYRGPMFSNPGMGTMFRIGNPTTLLSFDGTNGANPLGSLTLSGSTLYGMTANGGVNGMGTIFGIPASGGGLTTLHSFNLWNGRSPEGSLTLSPDGSILYGMTGQGGDNGMGTIFSIPASGGSLTTLLSFNGANGKSPEGSLTLSPDGSTLYGTTAEGGASYVGGGGGDNGMGTIFSIPASGGSLTTLLSFNGTNGDHPRGSLTLSPDGSTLYGTTAWGGSYDDGTVFSLSNLVGSPKPPIILCGCWGLLYFLWVNRAGKIPSPPIPIKDRPYVDNK